MSHFGNAPTSVSPPAKPGAYLTELEIRHLHEKIDHLLSHQWERLVQIQEIQIELLSDLSSKK